MTKPRTKKPVAKGPPELRELLIQRGLAEIEAAAVARFEAGIAEGFAEFLRLNAFSPADQLKLIRGLATSRQRGIELAVRPYPALAAMIRGAA